MNKYVNFITTDHFLLWSGDGTVLCKNCKHHIEQQHCTRCDKIAREYHCHRSGCECSEFVPMQFAPWEDA